MRQPTAATHPRPSHAHCPSMLKQIFYHFFLFFTASAPFWKLPIPLKTIKLNPFYAPMADGLFVVQLWDKIWANKKL